MSILASILAVYTPNSNVYDAYIYGNDNDHDDADMQINTSAPHILNIVKSQIVIYVPVLRLKHNLV